MPYFISDNNPDCSGWAVQKQNGEVIGCHRTRADAIDQMIAVSLAEDIAPGGYIDNDKKKGLKHGDHDQSEHGNWSQGSQSGNGKSPAQVYEENKMNSDKDVDKVYSAGKKLKGDTSKVDAKIAENNKIADKLNSDFRAGLISRAELEKGFKEYKSAHKEAVKEKYTNIRSSVGEKHLNGKLSGIKNYVAEVTSKEWFVEKFGDQKNFPTLEIKQMNGRTVAGRYEFGGIKEYIGNGESRYVASISTLNINSLNLKDESTLIHEIAHYATALSATEKYEGHGALFRENELYIASNLDQEYSNSLRNAYKEEGLL